jgi:hypothetical protein
MKSRRNPPGVQECGLCVSLTLLLLDGWTDLDETWLAYTTRPCERFRQKKLKLLFPELRVGVEKWHKEASEGGGSLHGS